MKRKTLPIITLLLLLLSGACLHAGEPARGVLYELIEQIQKHPEADFSKFIGKKFEFEGELRDRGMGDNITRIEVYTGPMWARNAMVDSGVVAHVFAPDPTKPLVFIGGWVWLHAEGILESVDPKTKTIVIKQGTSKVGAIAVD